MTFELSCAIAWHVTTTVNFMRKILIQLIGDQTLPNILPVLAISPDRIVNIYTEHTRKKCRKIEEWCKKYGQKYNIHPEFAKLKPIGTSIADTYNGINAVLNAEKIHAMSAPDTMLILNMTGGTKAMSTVAIMACLQISKELEKNGGVPIPIIYLNPTGGEIEFTTHHSLREQVLERNVQEVRLSVAEIIETGGDTVVVNSGKDWEQVFPAAEKLLQLAEKNICFTVTDVTKDNYVEKTKAPLSELLNTDRCENKDEAVSALKCLAALAETDEAVKRGMELCGFEARDGDFYLGKEAQEKVAALEHELATTPDMTVQKKDRKRCEMCKELNNLYNFFVGGWWEVIVAQAYKNANPESEVLWSVETATKNDIQHAVETDIIASDGHSLCCISCKRGMHIAKVTQELEQHCTRTEVLGGMKHSRIIAVYRSDRFRRLKSLLKELRLTMWNLEDVKAKIALAPDGD